MIENSQSQTLIESTYKELDSLTIRINNLQSIYKNINNKNLKQRLIREHSDLKSRFEEILSIILMINERSSEKISFSTLILEKYKRCKKEIYKNNYLFFI